jgi:2-polyprenyl-3-methyl-5-hydroxy-6-metoxy-1,4-benzoquinol methylase
MTTVFGPAFDAQWRQRFQRFAQNYTTEAKVSGWSDVGLARRLEIFSRLLDSLDIPSGSAVLDLGCGAGTYGRLLARQGHRVVGLDYSLPSLGRALQHDVDGACRYAAGDAYALPFAPLAFDLVICIGVLQAVAGPERVLAEATRVLRPGAVVVIEALNARALAARAGRAHAALRRLPPRVRHYDPKSVEQWLADRRLRLFARAPIMLPPRNLPGALRLLDLIPLSIIRRAGSPLTELAAHSFLFAARKAGCERPTCRLEDIAGGFA